MKLKLLKVLLNLDCKMQSSSFSTIVLINKRGNFVYHKWGCILIYCLIPKTNENHIKQKYFDMIKRKYRIITKLHASTPSEKKYKKGIFKIIE